MAFLLEDGIYRELLGKCWEIPRFYLWGQNKVQLF